MKVKTNVFFNGEHFPEELEEWLNELKAAGDHVVQVSIVQRPDEISRVITYAITDDAPFQIVKANEHVIADLEAEAKHAHQEVGALVSVILDVHRLAHDPSHDADSRMLHVAIALEKIVEAHPQGGTVVNLTKLLPPRG